jgi:hypothetical protein
VRENYPVIWGLMKGISLLGVALAGTLLVGSFLQSRAEMKNTTDGLADRSFIAQEKSLPRSSNGSFFERGREIFTLDVVARR